MQSRNKTHEKYLLDTIAKSIGNALSIIIIQF